MKTIQTFVLLLLLVATKTYAQDGIASSEIEKGTVSSEPENPESLAASIIPEEAIDGDKTETDSSTLPPQDLTAEGVVASSTGSPEINEEVPINNSEPQEIGSVQTDSEPSSEITNQLDEEAQGLILSASEPDILSPSEQKPIETDTVVLPTEKITLNDLEKDPSVPEIEKETESEAILPVEPLEQQPIGTETVVQETENIPLDNSEIDHTLLENVKETEGEANLTIEPVVPSEAITSSSAVEQGVESDTVSPTENKETVSVISTETVITETEAEIEEVQNSVSEGKEPNMIDPSENSNVDVTSGSIPESNSESPSYSPNPPIEPTESNKITAEPESTNNPLEESSTTVNPCTEVGNFPNPSNCRQYLSCSGNVTNLVAEEIQCPERSAFSPELQRCTRDLTPCGDEEPICLITSSIPHPNGENSSYFWCVPNLLGGFHKYQIQCSENEVFLSLIGRCWNETPLLGFGLINREPNDRDIVRAEWKLLKREIKLKLKEEKLRKKMEEKAKARAEKLAAKELRKQKAEDEDDN